MQLAGQDAELPEIRRRAGFFYAFVILAFLGLVARLFYLQIIEGDAFYRATSDSLVRTQTLPALRGQIRDRRGRVLASTRPAYAVTVTPTQVNREAFAMVRTLLSRDGDVVPTLDELRERAGNERTVTLAEDVPREIMAAIETHPDLAGIRVSAAPRRHYPLGGTAAHLLGYLNEISGDELRSLTEAGYKPGDVIGRTGLERQWEPYLRGQKGFEKIVVDRRGIRRSDVNVAELVEGAVAQEPVPGQSLVLTLDADLQRLAEKALRPHRAAAAVLLDVETGRILAMTSKPGFDPNAMSGRLSADVAARLFGDPLRPFRDRVLSETYNPGSTFKVISALAALEDRLITPEDRVKCVGSVQIGRRRFRCTKAHGVVNLHNAIVQSCNVFFYELAMRPGMMNRLARYATELGLGAPTGLGLNGEQTGLVVTEEWHNEQREKNPKLEGFTIGHALNTVIGEGSTRVTVLQMALVYAAMATGGKLWLPQLVERIENGEGQVIEEFPPRVRKHISLPPETLAVLRRALIGVANEPKGTAFKARSKRVLVAGKTGTAQVWRGAPSDPFPLGRLDHAWFAGFAPADKPRIAFAVLVEHGGHGGDVAAPVAMELVEGALDALATTTAAAPAPAESKTVLP